MIEQRRDHNPGEDGPRLLQATREHERQQLCLVAHFCGGNPSAGDEERFQIRALHWGRHSTLRYLRTSSQRDPTAPIDGRACLAASALELRPFEIARACDDRTL